MALKPDYAEAFYNHGTMLCNLERFDAALAEVNDSSYGLQAAIFTTNIASAMAAFPSRDREAHDGHWARILADSSCVARAIVIRRVDQPVQQVGAGVAQHGRQLALEARELGGAVAGWLDRLAEHARRDRAGRIPRARGPQAARARAANDRRRERDAARWQRFRHR